MDDGSDSMKALRFDRFGRFEEVMHVAGVGVPAPRSGEVLVKVAASSVNGGPLFEKCLKSLAQLGRQVNITSVCDRRVSFDKKNGGRGG